MCGPPNVFERPIWARVIEMVEYYFVISPEQTCTMTYTLHLFSKSFEHYSLFPAAELLNSRKYLSMELGYRAE